MTTTQTRLIDELDALHSSYVGALNTAVDAGRHTLVDELAADYERDAILLMAEREGRQDLLGHFGMDRDGNRLAAVRATPLRRLANTFSAKRAA